MELIGGSTGRDESTKVEGVDANEGADDETHA
jgi:hypothetical protein